jgi:DeoR/GlpR family transcriptional regulator of sugar metabolism
MANAQVQDLLPKLRRILILKEINEKGNISIEKIVNDYDISKMTAWRDLKILEDEGQVQKVYGGAVVTSRNGAPEPFFEQKSPSPQKIAIARYAAKNLVHDNETIFLDGGTTPMEMIPFLSQKDLTIITNSLNSLISASQNFEFNVIGIGGTVRTISQTCVGDLAVDLVKNFNANSVFLSGIGLTVEHGLTEPDQLEISVKKAMCQQSLKKIVLVEATKIERISSAQILPVSQVTVLVTDERASPDFVQKMKDLGVDVRIVSPD